MNFQDILAPIEDFMVWSFDHLLVPLGNGFNTLITIGLAVGIGIWLSMQGKYSAKAKKENTLE